MPQHTWKYEIDTYIQGTVYSKVLQAALQVLARTTNKQVLSSKLTTDSYRQPALMQQKLF